jgi:hypothetical protein
MGVRFVLALSAVMLLLWLDPATAQETKPDSNTKPVSQLPLFLTPRGSAVATSLDTDPRLKVPVTIQHRSESVAKFLTALSKLTHVKMQTTDSEISGALVSFHYTSVPLCDICDSLTLHGWRWKRDKNKTWLLCPSSQETDNLRPHSDAEANMARLGHQFLEQFGHLPEDQQRAMWQDFEQPRSEAAPVMLSSLPDAMQDIVRQLMPISQMNSEERGLVTNFRPEDHMSQLNISLGGMHHSDYDSYSITVGMPGGSASISDFNVFHDPNEDYHTVSLSAYDAHQLSQTEKAVARTRDDAIKNDPRMQKKITLKGDEVTLPEMMYGLAPLAGFAYILPDHLGKQITRTMRFDNVPLYKVLDRLCALYDFRINGYLYGYMWGRRDNGIIVFHSASTEALADLRAKAGVMGILRNAEQ